MRRALLTALSGALLVGAVTGCSVEVQLASPAETTSAPSTAKATPKNLPGGAMSRCLVDDNCDGSSGRSIPVGVVCAPLPAAITAFDAQTEAAFPGGLGPRTSSGALSALTDLVLEIVDQCGFRVMVDIADEYPDPLYTWLRSTAVSALGEISALPDGLRCAELATLGLGPKQAVDYWFLWGAPA